MLFIYKGLKHYFDIKKRFLSSAIRKIVINIYLINRGFASDNSVFIHFFSFLFLSQQELKTE